MKKNLLVCFGLLSPFLLFLSAAASAGTVTLTSYYPSPDGAYNTLASKTVGVGDNNNDGSISASDVPATAGDIWVKGRVAIGATNPGIAKTYIFNNGTNVGLYIGNGNTVNAAQLAIDGPTCPHIWIGESGSQVFALSGGGDMTIAGISWQPGGGTWSAISDKRLKKNISNLNGQDVLNKLSQLQGVSYEWINPEEHHAGKEVGLLSQDLELIFPQWVKEQDPKGNDISLIPAGEKAKGIAYNNEFNAYIIEAIKALRAECMNNTEALKANNELKDQAIKDLQLQLKQISDELQTLKAGMNTAKRKK